MLDSELFLEIAAIVSVTATFVVATLLLKEVFQMTEETKSERLAQFDSQTEDSEGGHVE